MTTPNPLPTGSLVYSVVHGRIIETTQPSYLTYVWGAKGTIGLNPSPRYCVAILSGNVYEWIKPENRLVMMTNDAARGTFELGEEGFPP